jgi:hydroxymethylbilane synthase
MTVIRIGARASKLSQTQTRWVQARIVEAMGADPADADRVAPVVPIVTTGDRLQVGALREVGGKQLFTKEIEEALLDGRVDLAVHSMKDVPAEQPTGLVVAAVPEREDPRDAFLSAAYASLDALPRGARLGTASLRRQAQVLARRPDLRIGLLRGNVDTRIAKLEAGEHDAILLAQAGLNRLGLGRLHRELLDPVAAPPAPGQGALAVQSRAANAGADWLRKIHHPDTATAVAAERGALLALEGSCRTAMGAYAQIEGGLVRLIVEALAPDGRERWREEGSAALTSADPTADAHALGLDLGSRVRAAAGDRLALTA